MIYEHFKNQNTYQKMDKSKQNQSKKCEKHKWHFPENFPQKNVLIYPHHWEGAENIFNSGRSRIINLAFCIAVSTSNTTIQTKFNKFKLCTLIFFNNLCFITSEKQLFLTLICKTQHLRKLQDVDEKLETQLLLEKHQVWKYHKFKYQT